MTHSAFSETQQQVNLLYRDHHTWLVNWIFTHVKENSDAEDLAQNTFLRLLGKSEVPVLDTPRAYLKTVAKGLVINFYRRRDIEQAYLEALQNMPEPVAPSPEEICQTMELLVQISCLLEGLPEKAKQAFLMARLEGMKYQQIADQLGVTVSSVKKYMFQATRHCLTVVV